MDDLNQFEDLFIKALYLVDQSYYSTTYNNIEKFRDAFRRRVGKLSEDKFERFGERVFCYEFYHQLRILIDEKRKTNSEFLSGALLQGEVEKMQIEELVGRFGLELLDKEYTPDFLLHSPGNAAFHPFVIEVKCDHELTDEMVKWDLYKLFQFINNYHYKRGIFLTVNSSPDRIQGIINSLGYRTEGNHWGSAETEERQIILEIMFKKEQDKVLIVCKENQNSTTVVWKI